jgi:hypothetical protein
VGRPSSARKFDSYIEAWSFCWVCSIFFFLGDTRHEVRERDKAVPLTFYGEPTDLLRVAIDTLGGNHP